MKKNRDKQQLQTQNHLIDFCSSIDSGCEKHPSFVSSGVCAFCLRDRLLSLVCDECGEQRLSSCSCSSYSYSFSSPIGDVGSVGRISFLIENDNEDVCVSDFAKGRSFGLKRSSSTRVEIKRSRSGFRRLSALFRRSKDTDESRSGIWAAVSRSRSLCSFRGGGYGGVTSEDGGSMSVSGARSSSVTCPYSEPEHHRSSFSCQFGKRVSGLRIKEPNVEASASAFASGFIDLNLGLVGRDELVTGSFRGQNGDVSKRFGRKGLRVWRWIFRSRVNVKKVEVRGRMRLRMCVRLEFLVVKFKFSSYFII